MKSTAIACIVLALGLTACGSEPDVPEKTIVEGVDWTGQGISFKYPEGMRVLVSEKRGGPVVEVLEDPEKPSSVSVALHMMRVGAATGSMDLHRTTAAATTRKGLEADGAEFAPNAQIEREIAGEMRTGTVLEFDFGPAHYRLELYSLTLGDRLIHIVLRHEPHEKEIAGKAFDTMAATLATAE